jgi:arginase
MGDPLLIQVPYHLGREGEGMGAGPPLLADSIGGKSVVVDRGEPFAHEVGASFAVLRSLAAAVREAVAAERFPLVLTGNCASSVGTVAGLGRDDIGVVWLDAHPDFHTPETTHTGFFDGFGLALLTGAGWDTMRGSIAGHRPVPEEHVVLVARDPDPGERVRLDASRVIVSEAGGVFDALDELRTRVPAVYLHVDFDVLDPNEVQANSFRVPGGLSVDGLAEVVSAVQERFELAAAALSAYDPAFDPERKVPPVARRLASELDRTGAPA